MRKLMIALLLLAALLVPTVMAVPTFMNVSTGTSQAASLTLTANCTGSNRVGVVNVMLDDGPADKTVTGVTWGGTAMTSLANVVHTGGSPRVQVFNLTNPPSGSQSVVITLAQTNKILAGAVCFTEAGAITNLTSAEGTSTTASVTVPSTTNHLVSDTVAVYAPTLTIGAGQTERYNLEMGGAGATGHRAGGSTEAGATSVT
ncbi:MAG: hypothetical protein AABY13_00535, partial [Nanoarchaeota archaeon]